MRAGATPLTVAANHDAPADAIDPCRTRRLPIRRAAGQFAPRPVRSCGGDAVTDESPPDGAASESRPPPPPDAPPPPEPPLDVAPPLPSGDPPHPQSTETASAESQGDRIGAL